MEDLMSNLLRKQTGYLVSSPKSVQKNLPSVNFLTQNLKTTL